MNNDIECIYMMQIYRWRKHPCIMHKSPGTKQVTDGFLASKLGPNSLFKQIMSQAWNIGMWEHGYHWTTGEEKGSIVEQLLNSHISLLIDGKLNWSFHLVWVWFSESLFHCPISQALFINIRLTASSRRKSSKRVERPKTLARPQTWKESDSTYFLNLIYQTFP